MWSKLLVLSIATEATSSGCSSGSGNAYVPMLTWAEIAETCPGVTPTAAAMVSRSWPCESMRRTSASLLWS